VPDAQKTAIEYQQGKENLLSNWLVQCVIMAVLLVGVWLFIMRRMGVVQAAARWPDIQHR
jgi:AFG3 family protein